MHDLIRTVIKPFFAIVEARARYSAAVEFGTRPHWPPRGALQPWARRHGFPSGAVGDFLVRRKIAREGTDPQPFMEPAVQDSRRDIEAQRI